MPGESRYAPTVLGFSDVVKNHSLVFGRAEKELRNAIRFLRSDVRTSAKFTCESADHASERTPIACDVYVFASVPDSTSNK